MKTVLALDLGFGSTKVCYLDPKTNTLVQEKHISAVGKVPSTGVITDENAFEFEGNYYYLFDPATKLPNKSQMDLSNYETLREVSPIIISHIIAKTKIKFDHLVLGLSISMIDYSKDYMEYVSRHTHIGPDNISLMPQGIGSKITYDTYNLDPSDQNQFNGIRAKNFLGVDIGFNTVDVFQVINGETSSNAIQGFQGMGVTKVAENVIGHVLSEYKAEITSQTAKEVLEKGSFSYRGNTYDMNSKIKDWVIEYLKSLLDSLETHYGSSIDRMDRIIFVGGGAALLKKYRDTIKEFIELKYSEDFVEIPELPEFYNVIGYYAFGTKLTE